MDVAIYPASAAATCSVNVSSTHIHEDGEIGSDYYKYTFSATPGPAWKFDHFEAHMDFKTEAPWSTRQNWSGKIHTPSNPSGEKGWFKEDGSNNVFHCVAYDGTTWVEGETIESWTLTNVVAVFKQLEGDYEISATAYVDPDEALEAGCTAGASPDVQYGDLGETGVVTYTANPAEGWQFTSWSDGSSDPVHSVEYEFGPELVKEVSLTATFERQHSPGIKFHVSTTMTPDKARGNTSGDGDYEEGEQCGISAKSKCSLWIFDHWEFSTGETYDTQSVTFTVTADVACTAVFRHEYTGQLIYDADGSGSLICAADGDLLYNGDSVGP